MKVIFEIDDSVIRDMEEIASALENMGAEESRNFGTPQSVRDLFRWQAARLRKVLEAFEVE